MRKKDITLGNAECNVILFQNAINMMLCEHQVEPLSNRESMTHSQ